MEIVLGIEKKMSDEGYKSNISGIAGSGAGSMALAKHAASVTILSPANNTQLKGLKKHYGAVAGIFVCGAERQKDQSCGAARQGLDRELHLYELYCYLSVVDGGYGEAPRAMDK